MKKELEHIFTAFRSGAGFFSAQPFGDGHIHQTYLVKSDKPGSAFILQKINNYVFRDTHVLMENMQRITSHLAEKIPATGTGWEILEFFRTGDGKMYFTAEDGADWRLMNFIHHDTGQLSRCDVHLTAGEAYGTFINLLGDMPGPALKETIPDFHNLFKRLNDFRAAVDNALADRKKEAAGDILFASEKAEEMTYIPKILAEGKVRLRPTHNDTKLNNILFSRDGDVRAVIDLDTVMPGLPHYDFGDAIRSFGNSCLEDEKELERVSLRMDVFESFAKGFIRNLSSQLNDDEKISLVFAPPMFAYSQGIRFLGDYLTGDHYYKTAYPEHNLVRARNQFRLLSSMDEHFGRMKDVIEKLLI